jgi:hypothetical protein
MDWVILLLMTLICWSEVNGHFLTGTKTLYHRIIAALDDKAKNLLFAKCWRIMSVIFVLFPLAVESLPKTSVTHRQKSCENSSKSAALSLRLHSLTIFKKVLHTHCLFYFFLNSKTKPTTKMCIGGRSDLVVMSQIKDPIEASLEDVRCYNFSVGMPHRQEFYSPGHPANYPPKVDCLLVLKGFFFYPFSRCRFKKDFENFSCLQPSLAL